MCILCIVGFFFTVYFLSLLFLYILTPEMHCYFYFVLFIRWVAKRVRARKCVELYAFSRRFLNRFTASNDESGQEIIIITSRMGFHQKITKKTKNKNAHKHKHRHIRLKTGDSTVNWRLRRYGRIFSFGHSLQPYIQFRSTAGVL